MTAQWVHADWQLIDDDPQAPAVLGVTWGIGVLDEPLERVGALGTALAALRDELARPVELAPGQTGVPEILVDLDTDTCAVGIRGRVDVVGSAWQRMRTLFQGDIVGPDAQEVPGPQLPWATDLAFRTGVNSAPLAQLHARPSDVRERAAEILRRLDPVIGDVPRVFCTNRAELVGMAFGAGEVRASANPAWPDGTAYPALGSAPAASADPQRHGILPDTETAALCSFLVPAPPMGSPRRSSCAPRRRTRFRRRGRRRPRWAPRSAGWVPCAS